MTAKQRQDAAPEVVDGAAPVEKGWTPVLLTSPDGVDVTVPEALADRFRDAGHTDAGK